MEVNHPYNLVEKIWNLESLMRQSQLILVRSCSLKKNNGQTIIKFVTDKIEKQNCDLKNKKKAINIAIESIQNIFSHGLHNCPIPVDPLLIVGRNEENKFFVLTGNTVTLQHQQFLQSRLDYLNSLNQDELRILYRHTIVHLPFTDKNGAGLGLIDMIRKAQNRIDYHFTPLSDSFSFFSYKLSINDNQVTL